VMVQAVEVSLLGGTLYISILDSRDLMRLCLDMIDGMRCDELRMQYRTTSRTYSYEI
jgi:hypothetical protein